MYQIILKKGGKTKGNEGTFVIPLAFLDVVTTISCYINKLPSTKFPLLLPFKPNTYE